MAGRDRLQWKNVGQGHQGALEPKSTIRKALVSQEGPALYPRHIQKMAGSSRWDVRPQNTQSEGFQSLVLYLLTLPVVGGLRGTFSCPPQRYLSSLLPSFVK